MCFCSIWTKCFLIHIVIIMFLNHTQAFSLIVFQYFDLMPDVFHWLVTSGVDVETLSSRVFVIYTHKEPHVCMKLWCWDTVGPLEANKNLIGPKRAPVNCLKTHQLFWRSYTVYSPEIWNSWKLGLFSYHWNVLIFSI